MDYDFMMSDSRDLFKSTSLSASADMDFCFYDDYNDVTADVWKKVDLLPTPPRSPELLLPMPSRSLELLLPTPPRSPERDSGLVPEDEDQLFNGAANLGSSEATYEGIFNVEEDSIEDVIEHLSADEKALSDSIDEALSIMKDSDAAADVLLRDFMWSAPGLEALGFVPSVVTKPYYDADPLVGAPPTSTAASYEASAATAASYCDPSQVFGCVGVPRHLGNELSDADDSDNEDADELTADVEEEDIDEASTGARESGDSGSAGDAEESEDEDDDDEEIDVVSVQKHRTKVKAEPQPVYCAPPVRRCTLQQPQQQSSKGQHQRHHGNSLLSSSSSHHNSVYIKREYDDIPDDVASITSHVAAMHNYFNPSAAACSQSAPQSPTADYQQSRRDAYKRVRSYESYPPSPNSLLAKKPRMGSSDLRSSAASTFCRYKAGASSSNMGRYHHYGNMSRGSSAATRYPGNKQREMHNVLERKRRDDLRWNFMSLRGLLPSMSASRDRMPKVVILRKSREYIRALKISFQKLSEELANQEARNKELRRRLQDLRDDQCLEL